MTFKDEERELYRGFLERYFFSYWRANSNQQSVYKNSLELFLTPQCDLKCKYCYLNKFENDIYPKEHRNFRNIVNNTHLLFEYFQDRGLFPPGIDLFTGGAVPASIYDEVLHIIYDFFLKAPVRDEPYSITIPTNLIFINSREKREMLLKWRKKFMDANIRVFVSCSLDGKYADPISRPTRKNNFKYDDRFYERTKEFARIVSPGFHPMIAPENIRAWIDNFDWYIKYISDIYNCSELEALDHLYLLEVRNPNWSKTELLHLTNFIFHATKRVFTLYDNEPGLFVNQFLKSKALNMYSSLLGTVGRGISCSIQSALYVRVGDLHIIPCHRTSWPNYESGKFIVENNEIINIEPINPWTHIAIVSFNAKNGFVCSHCPINELCSFYCLGANLEFNRDLFVPIPSVCRMEHHKIKSILKSFEALEILPAYYEALKERGAGLKSIIKLRQAKNLLEER